MEERGPSCTADEAACRELLQDFTAVSEHDVAEALGMMARTQSSLDPTAQVRPPAGQRPVLSDVSFGSLSLQAALPRPCMPASQGWLCSRLLLFTCV